MNGYECGNCGMAPCVCAERRRKKRIRDGKIAIESLWQAMVHLPRWRMKIVKWLWPDFVHVASDFLDYYWKDDKDEKDRLS